MFDSTTGILTQFPVTYYYDADGRRVMKAVCGTGTACSLSTAGAKISTYVYDQAGDLAAEYGPSGGPTTAEYLFTDHLGSTRMMVEAATGTIHCYDYTPFGLELGAGQSGRAVSCYEQLPYPTLTQGSVLDKFTSKERDAETGLDFFGARYMSSAQGRFTSPDELASGVGGAYGAGGYRSLEPRPLPYADVADPQSLNKYTYALNNPLRYVDPDGHCVDGVSTFMCVVAAVIAGGEVLNIVAGMFEATAETGNLVAYGDYVRTLREHAMDVCAAGKPECGAAREAYQKTYLEFLKRSAKTTKTLAGSVPGTTMSGPPPTSGTDLITGSFLRLFTIPLDFSSDAQQKQKRPDEPNARPDPNKKDCLLNRDGTCVQ